MDGVSHAGTDGGEKWRQLRSGVQEDGGMGSSEVLSGDAVE